MGKLEYNCKHELGLTKQSTSTTITDSADTGTEDTENGNTCIGSHNIGTGSDVLALVLLV